MLLASIVLIILAAVIYGLVGLSEAHHGVDRLIKDVRQSGVPKEEEDFKSVA
jgi:hypothetical protein